MSTFVMPSLGADMEAGTLIEWLKQPGDEVKRGDVVAVVETQKGAIEIEIFDTGVIDQILVQPGQQVPVGTPLAMIRANGGGQHPEPIPPPPPPGVPPLPEEIPPGSPPETPPPEIVPPPEVPPAPPIEVPPAPPIEVPEPPMQVVGGWVRISPAARRRAEQLGIDVAGLRGTGLDGAITLADVEGMARPEAGAPRPARRGFDPEAMRQAIAAAMSRSKREIPHYYLTQTIELTRALAWLETTNRERPPTRRLLPAVLLLKATALALRQVPELNGYWEKDAFRPGPGIHVGWAIALRGGGLIAPAVRDADQKPLTDLMTALRDLVQRARSGGLRSSELSDPTITVTSLGERGAEAVIGVIYPPQVAIVGFGRIAPRPWAVDGALAVRSAVTVSLAADHRASDGHRGGLLLAEIDRLLQEPEAL